ncbi:MAG: beta-D-glucoside glucohydrolase [Alphaproteobacteria bacterium]|nr:beta-D-glucoside glucohydrolase [Alphaproteobacteria bacterium]
MRETISEIRRQAAALLERLTLEEKAALLAGADLWTTVPLTGVGLPAIAVADGPNGLRSNESEPTTVFPVGVAMAATWNPELVREAAAAMGREARAKGVHVLLGPSINIQRTPLGGRNFETYSEDPHLAGELGVAFVEGVQGEGIGASVKHYAANNQEHERRSISANVGERALREIYLPAFEAVVTRARPWTVMAAYNRVNGTFMSAHRHLLDEVLRGEWGFDGVVVSDWGAVHATDAVAAGLDWEMPGPPRHFGPALAQAVASGAVTPEAVDRAAAGMLTLVLRAQAAGGGAALNTPAHQEIARRAAEEAIVLLKNDGGLLPLDAGRLRRVAVIGPNADEAIIQGGGSAHAIPFRETTPLDALRALLGDGIEIVHAPGLDNEPVVPLIDRRLLSHAGGNDAGLAATYYASDDWSGLPVRQGVEAYLHKFGFPDAAVTAADGRFSALWEGFLCPDRTGAHEIAVEYAAKPGTEAEICIDGELVAGPSGTVEPFRFVEVVRMSRAKGTVTLEAGRRYRIEVRYRTAGGALQLFRVGLRKPSGSVAAAVEAARGADVALVFVGVSRSTDSEGYDRPDMELYGGQDDLVDAVAAANPNTVVVLQNGAPVTMPWLSRVRAVLTAWLPGQEGGHAVARVLTGAVAPSGKLPHTMPARLEDNPSFVHYPGTRDADYGEGIFVGYRYYDKARIEPLFPFGFGLSYTRFAYSDLRGPGRVAPGEAFTVSVVVTNTGGVAGKETVQLYVEQPAPSEVRPLRELKGFRKIALAPGEHGAVSFRLAPRDLARYDVHECTWVAEPGLYRIHVGGSSRDLPLVLEVRLDG